ncbi:MAG: hypothetical protein IJF98_04835 [Firmicutes bacterium]|nr:hypothetical protein [Bacillota bacterium]
MFGHFSGNLFFMELLSQVQSLLSAESFS